MAKSTHETVEVVQDPSAELDPEDVQPIRAYKLMPRWGQLAAWCLWEMPGTIYVTGAGVVVWRTYAASWWWGALVWVFVLVGGLGYRARRSSPNPFRQFVLVTRKPVPNDVLETMKREEPETAQ